ncbi:MAG: trypsin-like peptidase domain-containing protein [Spirochaetia bacterium]|jgi:S1-C subfamily serine protease|nr:trypsin-like peptidase domain-containing protein [Spirochaetia bacterium]
MPKRDFHSLSLEQLKALVLEDPESSLETISMLRLEVPDEPGLQASWTALENEALLGLIERFEQESSEGRWASAEMSLSSLGAALIALPENLILNEYFGSEGASFEERRLRVLMGRSEALYAQGLYAPGVNYLYRILDRPANPEASLLPKPETSFFEAWLERSRQKGDRHTVERLSALLGQEKSKARTPNDAAQEATANAQPSSIPAASLAELAEAVVTIHVDKGLKIQRGLAYPDRVLGSAFQLDDQGYYLTNYHVISSEVDPEYEGYSSLSIRPFDKPEARIPARVVGWNEELDVALVKSEQAKRTLYLHSSKDPAKGQRVYSIGSPVGLESSVASGIISAPGRRILARGDALQIDVPVNPGSSGGPLLDDEGRVVGLIFAGLSGFQGLNFALPPSWISSLLPSLFEGGQTELSWLGLGLARTLDGSLEISYVFPWRQAIVPGDRILSIDTIPVKDLSLAQYLLTEKPLSSLSALRILRGNKEIRLLAKTRAMPKSPMVSAVKSETSEALLQGMTGMILEHISGSRGPGGSYKILKLWPGLPADEFGLREGDLIKFVRYRSNSAEKLAVFDISVKSPASGYLEKTMRLVLSLEMNNFI